MTERGEQEIRKIAAELEAEIARIAAKAVEAAELLRPKVIPIRSQGSEAGE